MNILLPSVRTALIVGLSASAVLVAGTAAGAYSGSTRSGEILTCFARSDGALRIVDHLPCKKGETALRWNSRGVAGEVGKSGRDGTNGTNGTDGVNGADGTDGGPGPAGRDGRDGTGLTGEKGEKGEKGDAGTSGAKGDKGDKGDAGSGQKGDKGDVGETGKGEKGDVGPRGEKGEKGDVGPQGPAGDASVSSSMQFGQTGNSNDPDCAMVGPVGRSSAAACNFGAIQQVGEYLPTSAGLSRFRVLLDKKVSTPVDIIARAIDPATSSSVQAFAVCTVPAGSNTCTQSGERTLNGPNLFAFQFSGDRSWTTARFGYVLVQA